MDKLDKPLIRPGIEYNVLSNGNIQIRGVDDNITINGSQTAVIKILKLIDGNRTISEIGDSIRDIENISIISNIINTLESRGYLISASNNDYSKDLHISHIDFLRTKSARFHPGNKEGFDFNMFLEQPLILLGQGMVFDSASSSLQEAGYQLEINPEDLSQRFGSLAIACCDFEDLTYFQEINREAVLYSLPILFCHFSEYLFKIGPLVVPKHTACFECYSQRLRIGSFFPSEFNAYVENNSEKSKEKRSVISPLLSKLIGYLVTDKILKHTAGIPQYSKLSEIVSFNTLQNSIEKERVLKLPRCAVCGLDWVSRPTKAIRDLL